MPPATHLPSPACFFFLLALVACRIPWCPRRGSRPRKRGRLVERSPALRRPSVDTTILVSTPQPPLWPPTAAAVQLHAVGVALVVAAQLVKEDV